MVSFAVVVVVFLRLIKVALAGSGSQRSFIGAVCGRIRRASQLHAVTDPQALSVSVPLLARRLPL